MKKNSVKIISVILTITLILSCIPFSAFAAEPSISGSNTENYEISNPTFATMSDTHVFTDELVENSSKDYIEDVLKRSKLLGETFPILDAALQSIEKSVKDNGLRYLFLTGDLTANGELRNHELLGQLLRSFQNKMRREYDKDFHIFVIPGNHDISNYGATTYDKDGNAVLASSSKETAAKLVTSSAQFAYCYRELGYGAEDQLADKITYYKNNLGLGTFTQANPCKFDDNYANLTYSVDLKDSSGNAFRAVFIDGCEYSTDVAHNFVSIDGVKYPTDSTYGYMNDEHLDWICTQTKAAVANGEAVVGATHFATVPHFTQQAAMLKMFIYNNWQHVASKLADAGMHYYFSGHMHAPDVACYTNENGKTIYDVETGSLSNYSNTYRENSLTLNGDGTIKFNTVCKACDYASQVDLSKVWYEYDEYGNPVQLETKCNIGANSKVFKKISKPFSDNYGIYLFTGTRLNADENGDSITKDENGETLLPNIKALISNTVSDYLDGGKFTSLIKNGGIKGAVEKLLGCSLEEFLDKYFSGDTLTVSVITLKKQDVLKLANLIFDEIDSSYIGYVAADGSVVKNNQKLTTAVNSLIDKLLDFKIGGYPLSTIGAQCLIGLYSGNTCGKSKWFDIDAQKISENIKSDNFVNNLIDYLIKELLGYTAEDESGNTVQHKGTLIDLLRELNISIDMINSVLPDFAGILRYPALRKLLLGSADKAPSIISIADNWAGKIITDKFNFKTFETGEVTETSVTDTASLAEYFIFTLADDYLNDNQLHIVSTAIDALIKNFTEDAVFTPKSEQDTSYPFIDSYDLKSLSLISGGDNCASIDYKPLTPKSAADSWYKLPQSISVTFGGDTSSSKNFNWFTNESVTGSDIQIIPYKANAAVADFSAENLLKTSVSSTCKAMNLVYPTIDIGIWADGEGTLVNRHTACVSGLEAGTKYCYRVGDASKGLWSKPETTQTAKGGKSAFTFLHMTDSQCQTKEQYDETYGKVLENAFSSFPNSEFILHTGDMVDYGANMLQWNWALGENGIADTTIASTAGNHEPKGTNTVRSVINATFGTSQDTFFNINAPEQDNTNGVYYDFDYNNVHFMVLNTNNLNSDNTLSDAQLNWLTNSVSSSDSDWNVVAMHKSIYSNGSHYKDSDVTALRAQLSKLMPQLGIDIVFSGHDHVLVRTQAMNSSKVSDTFSADSSLTNPTGTVYSINGKSGIKDYNVKNDELISKYFDISSCKTADVSHLSSYSAVSINGDKLSVESFVVNRMNSQQTKVDSFSINKEKLTVPQSFKAQPLTVNSIKLAWNKVDGARTYTIYTSDSQNGAFKKLAETSALTYTDTSLKTGSTYYYKICAGSGNYKSEFSTVISAKATLAAVQHFRASKKSTTTIQTSWSKLTSAKTYKLYLSTSKTSGYKLAATTANTNYVIKNLTKGKTYYIQIRANNGTTDGILSEPVAVKM